MKKVKIKKLVLNKESIVKLSNGNMDHIVGGKGETRTISPTRSVQCLSFLNCFSDKNCP